MKKTENEILDLINLDNPVDIFHEISGILTSTFPDFDINPINRVFHDVVRLFRGEYPGFKACNTEYHDLDHTANTTLAMVRLMHGAILRKQPFSRPNITLGVISTLLHDAGYIQSADDDHGTGAKYTATHIERSIEFMKDYLLKNGYSLNDFENCSDMLNCTGLNTKTNEIKFQSKEIEMLGKILGTADLLSQMADRVYLEKLLFLFYEFKEGNIPGYASELELLKKTIGFYHFTQQRLVGELGGMNKYAIYHFRERWGLDRDLYAEHIEKNKNYLEHILKDNEQGYRGFLRRKGIVQRLTSKF